MDGQSAEAFGETEAGRWLAANARKFGFIIRYPRGNFRYLRAFIIAMSSPALASTF